MRALTLDYAAPEQLRGESVSTSADVYALGVLLYELLTGTRPYRTGLAGSELERAILEEEPESPSARVEAGDLRRRLRGDLDRIALKALQKSPERRYSSVEAFTSDVRRHLAGLPVAARGDALSYRARKFLARHRAATGAAALVLLTLVAGLFATAWQAQRAAREARKAEAVKEFLKTLLSAADPTLAKGREPSVRQLLDAGAGRIETELRDQPDVQSEVASLVASVYHSLGEYNRALPLLRADLERRKRRDGPRSVAAAEAMTQIADALYEQGRYDEAGPLHEEALAIQRERRGERSLQVAELLWDIGGERRNRGDLTGAEAFDKQALAIYVALKGDDSADAAAVRESLGIVYSQLARFTEAAALQRPVVLWRERHLGADHPHTLTARYNLAFYLQALGHFDDAVAMTEDVVTATATRAGGPARRVGRHTAPAGAGARRRRPGGGRPCRSSPRRCRFTSSDSAPTTCRWHTIASGRRSSRRTPVVSPKRSATVARHSGSSTRNGAPPRADLPNLRMWIGIVLAEAGQTRPGRCGDRSSRVGSAIVAAGRAVPRSGARRPRRRGAPAGTAGARSGPGPRGAPARGARPGRVTTRRPQWREFMPAPRSGPPERLRWANRSYVRVLPGWRSTSPAGMQISRQRGSCWAMRSDVPAAPARRVR